MQNRGGESSVRTTDDPASSLGTQAHRGGASFSKVHQLLPLWSGAASLVVWACIHLATTKVGEESRMLQRVFATNYRLGSSLYGIGPFMVPLLAKEFIHTIVSESQFFQGVQLVEAFPGSTINVAAYIGAIQQGWKGAAAAHVGIALPGILLAFAILPFWSRLREQHGELHGSVSRGVVAAAVGLLVATCISMYSTVLKRGLDAAAFLAFGSLLVWKNVSITNLILLGAALGVLM